MSGSTIVKTLSMGKGVTLDLIRDDALPASSIDHWRTVATATGEGEPLSVPLHWHKNHSEHFQVLEGRIEVTLDGVKSIVSAGESLLIKPYVRHGFQGFAGERAVVTERADPPGDYKVNFFNDLLSTGWPAGFWHMMRTFYDGDGYPDLGLYFSFFDVAFITVVGGVAKLLLPAKPKLE